MPKVTLYCPACGYTARRELTMESGSRGIHETSSEPGYCPQGHGLLLRQDGVRQERWALWNYQPCVCGSIRAAGAAVCTACKRKALRAEMGLKD